MLDHGGRVDLGDHVWRYEKRGNADHAHFICGSCGVVACLPDANVSVRGVPGRIGRVAEVLLKGSCPDCAA